MPKYRGGAWAQQRIILDGRKPRRFNPAHDSMRTSAPAGFAFHGSIESTGPGPRPNLPAMNSPASATSRAVPAATPLTRGQWMALIAAFLGWLFDGFEIGLFPVVARPALQNMLGVTGDALVGVWMGRITAVFLIGAACGGALFGWLGDRIGRVRAMSV